MKCDYCNADEPPKIRLEFFGSKVTIKHFCSKECLGLWVKYHVIE